MGRRASFGERDRGGLLTLLAYFSEMSPVDAACMRGLLPQLEISADERTLDAAPAPAETEILSVMVHSKVDADVISSLPRLRLIATRSTGFDHIDLDAATERGITVCNVPSYGSNTVAEHTFGLILALARRIHKAHVQTLQGEYSLEGLMGTDLSGKTLGVVGAGKIGQHVIRIGEGFGMKVLASDPYEDQELARLLRFRYVPFDRLVESSDVIAVCCPLNDSTKHLFNQETFSHMRKGVIFVNTARGAVVQAKALLWALQEEIVSGAGLDVLEGEEMLAEDTLVGMLASGGAQMDFSLVAENLALMRHPNVIVTPHMAFYSSEALRRILDTTAENIQAFIAGSPKNTV